MFSTTSSVFPSMWKVAIIRPVVKVGPSDSRPISTVSVLSKAVERILHDQVLKHVNGPPICCWIFSLVSDVSIAPRLLWSGLPRI
jgi:hypothetical protein